MPGSGVVLIRGAGTAVPLMFAFVRDAAAADTGLGQEKPLGGAHRATFRVSEIWVPARMDSSVPPA